MKQNFHSKIIKLLFTLLLFSSTSIQSQNLYYTWTGLGTTTAFSDVNNWEETSNLNPPTDFKQDGDVFDFGGATGLPSFDLAGMTLGKITIKNPSTTSITIENTGTLTISSQVVPVFSGTFAINFAKSGSKIIYTAAPSTGMANFMSLYTHNDVELNYNTAINSTTTINGNLTIKPTYNLEANSNLTIMGTINAFTGNITINTGSILSFHSTVNNFSGTIINYGTIELGANCALNTGITGSVDISTGSISDLRSVKSYPGTWIYSLKSGTPLNSIMYISPGTYNKLDVRCITRLLGNTTVSSELILNNAPITNRLELYTYTLTISGVVKTSSTNYIRSAVGFVGSLIFNAASTNVGTIYFTSTELKNLTVTNGASVTLGNALSISAGVNYGTVTVESNSTLNTGGFLTLKANASGSARIGESAGVISGEYTAETYIPATGRKYRFLASPVVGGTALEWRDNGGSTASRGLQITGNNGSTNGFDVSTTNNPSAYYYNEANAGSDTSISAGIDDAGWTAFSHGDGRTSLENSKGYRVLVRGDRLISLSANPAPAANATTIWVKGTYPGYSAGSSSSQSITKTLSYTSSAGINKGINLVGNPYPSTIDWNAVTKGANVDAGYITYDPGVTGKIWTSASRYRAYNGSTGGAGRYISAGQGFLVYTSSNTTGNSITFEENDKVTNAGGGFFAEKLTNHLIVSFIYDSVYYDEAYLHFREDARDIRDRYDVVQFINPTVNVATIDSTGNSYNINSLVKLENKRSVFVNIANNPILDYKIKFNDLGTFANHRIFLKDNFKKETIEIFEGNEYPITITADPMSNAKNRIELVFEPISASLKRISNINIISLETNPVMEKLVLKNNEATKIGTAQINIINTTGQLIETKVWETSNSDSFEYQTQKLSTGIYFIEIASKNYSQTIKFTKQ